MSTERDELAALIRDNRTVWVTNSEHNHMETKQAEAILAAGYRKIFDGDCGLSNAAPDERDAAEAWMRWANILTIGPDEERNGIAAMRQMLTEFGYRKPRTVTTKAELDALAEHAVILSDEGGVFEHEHGWWRVTGSRDPMASSELALPATVLHEGEAE